MGKRYTFNDYWASRRAGISWGEYKQRDKAKDDANAEFRFTRSAANGHPTDAKILKDRHEHILKGYAQTTGLTGYTIAEKEALAETAYSEALQSYHSYGYGFEFHLKSKLRDKFQNAPPK